MDNRVNILSTWSNATISLDDLLQLFHHKGKSYDEISQSILELEDAEILQPVKATGRTTRQPSLAYRYRIMKARILREFHTMLHRYNQELHSTIRLDSYYSADKLLFENDLPYVEKIDVYIKINGFPEESVPAPERSVELVGDEKWIDEKGGRELLERIGLWDKLAIVPVSDPLMLAVNRDQLHNNEQFHLIVENKTTYQALLPVLMETNFSTLIYGSGNKIVKSIEQFDWQVVTDASVIHTLFYFGDIDRSGITIWRGVTKHRQVFPAIPFYEACLKKQPLTGKTNQRKDPEAVRAFITAWNDGQMVEPLFESGKYYPQEILTSSELREIWRKWSCHLLNGTV